MCFRFLAAVRGADAAPVPTKEIESLAFSCGLDVRVAPLDSARGERTGFVEVAWGDCACSLYAKGEGRGRAIRFVEGLSSRGLRVQLLLFQDADPLELPPGPPQPVPLDDFRREALGALPEGRVAELI